MSIPPAFLTELHARRSRIADARRSLEMMEAELRGWEDAMRLISGSPVKPRGEMMADRLLAEQPARSVGDDGGRSISTLWRNILAATADVWPRAATLDDIMGMAERLGTPIQRNTLRSQASIYAEKGYIEREGQGAYRLTRAGAERLGVRLPEPAAAPSEPTNTETAPPDEEGAAAELRG